MRDVGTRSFRQGDLPAAADLYDRVLAPMRPRYSWPLSVQRFQRQYLGHPEFREDGLFVAEKGGRIVGFAFGALRMDPITPEDTLPGVFVSLLLVDEPERRRGIGTALLERVAEFGGQHGKTLLSAHANPMSPLALWPGVNRNWADAVAFLRHHGFVAEHTEVSMEQKISGFAFSEYVRNRQERFSQGGFRVVRYQPRWRDALLALSGSPFWHLDLLSKIERLEHPFIETAFLNLALDSIYGPEDVTLLVRGDELAGFVVLCRNPGEKISYLGPIRVAEKYQHGGLGSWMIQQALLWERLRGVEAVDLWCSQDNARRFYAHNGFVQCETWDLYERPL